MASPLERKSSESTEPLGSVENEAEKGTKKRVAALKPLTEKKKKKKKQTFGVYIPNVLKHITTDISISPKAMAVIDTFLNDIFDRLATAAARLAIMNKRSTISAKEIQTSVRMIVPGQLCEHAVSSGTVAVSRYKA